MQYYTMLIPEDLGNTVPQLRVTQVTVIQETVKSDSPPPELPGLIAASHKQKQLSDEHSPKAFKRSVVLYTTQNDSSVKLVQP
eukprot:18989-Heterococcus_DN1.PRE.1